MNERTRFISLNIVPPIDKVGFQIRKDGSTFSDVKTGSIPQIDAIIKTNDDRIYKTTQNLNSTYTDADGNTTTTKNAAEPLGASMSELFLKEYKKVISSEAGSEFDYGIIYDGSKFIVCGFCVFAYSKDGSSWTNCIIPDDIECAYNVYTSIAYGNNNYCAVSSTCLGREEYKSNVFLHSTDGITWKKVTTETSQCWNSVCYGNGKFVAVGYNFDENSGKTISNIAAYSLDGITWAEVTMPSSRMWQSVCYGNGKFVATSNDIIVAYSTNGSTWTEVTVPNSYHTSSISFIHNKFILISKYDGTVSESSDGITWTNLEQDYSKIANLIEYIQATGYNITNVYGFYTSGFMDGISTELPYTVTFLTKLIEYDSQTAIGYFMAVDLNKVLKNNENDPGFYFIIAKSNDLKSWDPVYKLDNPNMTPMNIICNKDRVITIGMTYITANYQAALVKEIEYKWSISGSSVALSNDKILPKFYLNSPLVYGEPLYVDVDTTYSAGITDPHEDKNGGYVFSGWDKTGKITLTPESDFRTVVSGIWEWKAFYRYNYSWNASTVGVTGVTLPSGDYVATGSKVTVDKNYTSDSNIDIMNWTKGTMPSSQRWESVCYGNGKFVVTCGNGATSEIFAYSSDGITWTQGTMPSKQNWISVCYGNGKFVAVARNTDIFAYSTDGITWTQGNMPSTQDWDSVCYGNGKFVAVVSSDKSDAFAYSTDGITWTQGTIPSKNYWTSVCYGNGKFVAISIFSNIFAYSTDGINWTEGTMPSKQYWESMCYGNGKFVAIASGTIFAYSTDGINWTEGTMPSSQYWESVCYGNGKFVATTNFSNKFAYSSDGITWTEGTLPSSQNWHSVCYGNNKFVAIAQSINIFAYLPISTYYNFSGWDKSDFNITEDTTISGIWSKKNKLKVTYSWTGAPSDLVATVPETGYYMPNALAYVDKNYNNKVYKESSIWTQGTAPSKQAWVSVCYGNGKFVAIAESTIIFAYSTDGINWTEGTMPSDQQWNSVCYGNDKFVAIAWQSNVFAYSSDGINWTEGTMPSYDYWSSVCYGNGKYVAVTSNNSSNVFAYSTNGINWTKGTMPSGQIWHSVCYGNNKFVAIIISSNVFTYSSDGINWTEGTMPSKQAWVSVCYGNGKFVAIAESTIIFAYSTDGINWTEGTMPSKQYWESMCYGNGKFVAIASGTIFAYSTDGINWTEGTMPSSQYWESVCYGNDKFVAISKYVSSNNAFAYLPISTYFNFSGWNKSDFNITENTTISGTWNKINTFDWINNSVSNTGNWYSVCYGNGKFVVITIASNVFAYSTDGITWTKGTMPSKQGWYSVCYGNGKFVAIAQDTNVFAYSTDGITWTKGTMPSSQKWSVVCYGKDKFVVITYNSTAYAYSTDGITWTQGTLPATRNCICYGNDKFVAMTNNASFSYSTDGITWTNVNNTDIVATNAFFAITYGNGVFVAVDRVMGSIIYSTNGTTWRVATTAYTQYWTDVCYGNGIFVAVGNYNNISVYSTDGIHWTSRELITNRNTAHICYGDGKFVTLISSDSTQIENNAPYNYFGLPEDAIIVN